ncbi:hypothetical protein CKJ64_15425 [Mycobacterium avium]|nr:hypothetical protein CKJ64_15425 [Mycobacterium avium]
MVVSPQRLTRWPSYVRDRHAAITYTTPRDAPRPTRRHETSNRDPPTSLTPSTATRSPATIALDGNRD